MDNALFSLDFQSRRTFGSALCAGCRTLRQGGKTGRSGFADALSGSPLLTTLLEKGYQAFAEETLKLRHNMGLPPFSFQALFKAQCRHSEEAENALSQLASFFYEQK